MAFLSRDVYYADKVLFGTQQAVDEVFNDLACMLQVPRSSLHVVNMLYRAIQMKCLQHGNK